MFGRPVTSLAAKLIIALGTMMIFGSLLFGYIFIRYEENIMMKNLMNYASSTASSRGGSTTACLRTIVKR